MTKAPKRLLLVEFFPTALRRNEKSMLFPFLKGLARDGGFETLWLCFGGDTAQAPDKTGRTIFARLPAADLRRLSSRLDRFRPTHVVTSDFLCPESKALMTGRTSPPKHLVMPTLPDVVWGARRESEGEGRGVPISGDPRRRDYFGRCAWFLDWLGLVKPAGEQRYLIWSARPDYDAEMANPSARSSPAHITIVSGALCGIRRTLGQNPYFQGVDLRSIGPHHGCSFCSSASIPSLTPPGADLAAIVEAQFRGILETAGAAGRNKGVYEFYDFRAFWKFDEMFDVILRLRLPPSIFLFNPRLDAVLGIRRRIERMLPALAKAGHEVRFLSMGIENFSERENRRFNKNVSLEQVDEFLALTKKWNAAYPGAFRPFKAGHDKVELGFILFTPWTTLSDLRLNLTRARARRFSETGYWLYSTLHIRNVEPICALARKEGDVLVERWPDRGLAYGLFKNEGEAGPLVPWRFKDPRVADYFAMLVRVCAADREGTKCAFFQDDPEYALVLDLYARARVTPLRFALTLLKLMEASQPPYAREALLRKVLVRKALARTPPKRAVAPKAPPRPAPSVEARAVERVLRQMKKTRFQADSKMDFQSVADVWGPGPRRLRLTFSAEGRKLILDLLDGRSPEPCYLRSRLFRAVYHSDAPVTSPRQTRFLTLMLRLIDGAVSRNARAAQPFERTCS